MECPEEDIEVAPVLPMLAVLYNIEKQEEDPQIKDAELYDQEEWVLIHQKTQT